MKALFCIRRDCFSNFAGDSMQLMKTAKYLREKKVKVDINTGSIYDYSRYDIIHLFNLTRVEETYKYYKRAKYYNKTIVLSPIYWNLTKYYNHVNDTKNLILWDKLDMYRKEILMGCKSIYPNSKLENIQIQKDFHINAPYNIIYNGMEIEHRVPYNFKKAYGLNDYVLCVGRICGRKNQLALSKICSQLGLQLVLIGSINDMNYFNKCMSYNNVRYLGFMNDYNIYNANMCARMHILPSFVETPGLSSLEAAASGCNIVSTIEGSTREYFKNMCIYCDPYNEHSIKDAIIRSFEMKKDEKLKKYVIKNYNWRKCINVLFESYKSLVK
ncbi:glycosyltransferase [Clostridium sp. Mt-5]|uniref:Glycosyltransferase n=1 Tax=Clostridium moutaii TaxID=3240932 RepID=A0ABV4BPF9_9CLOT